MTDSVAQRHHASQEQDPFLTVHGFPVYFQEDWSTGIGGGLWSTGLAIGKYLQTDHAREQLTRSLSFTRTLHPNQKMTVVELGSGNGLLSLCWLALTASILDRMGTTGVCKNDLDLYVSDVSDHLPLIQQTLRSNQHILERLPGTSVTVVEHRWGEFDVKLSGDSENQDSSAGVSETESTFGKLQDCKVDVILGSDLAYREELYDPLIASYKRLANETTVILLGVTMADTMPSFFDRLHDAGFEYSRLADHLMDPKFRGQTFGIFLIHKVRRVGRK